MRPPHYTGENPESIGTNSSVMAASMRPPHYTGENIPFRRAVVSTSAALQ